MHVAVRGACVKLRGQWLTLGLASRSKGPVLASWPWRPGRASRSTAGWPGGWWLRAEPTPKWVQDNRTSPALVRPIRFMLGKETWAELLAKEMAEGTAGRTDRFCPLPPLPPDLEPLGMAEGSQ